MRKFGAGVVSVMLAVSGCAMSQASGPVAASAFAPLDQWKTAVLTADAAALQSLYSTTPAMQVTTASGPSDAGTETNFWIGLKVRKINLDIIQTASAKPGVQVIVFQAEVQPGASKEQILYVTEAQAWQQQADQWHLAVVKRTEPAHLKQPANKDKNIYAPGVDAHAELKEAEDKAAKEHKRVLLVFGANWCYDCHVLDLAFQRLDLLPVVGRYEIVHVDIGEDGKKNADLAKQFEVPLNKGVPALAVVESTGKLVVSQKNGEFENARAMTPDALLEFLNHWKLEAQ